MNKNLIDQLPGDEKPVAEKLSAAAETMKLSQSFQWNLETQLMDAYISQNEKQTSVLKFWKPIGWALATVAGILLISWMLPTLLPGMLPAAEPIATQQISFEDNVRQGNLCAAPLALAHNFSVFLTSPDKTQFAMVDTGGMVGEMRSFTWSADGERLAIVVNTAGRGNIHITDLSGGPLEYVLSSSEPGYLMEAAWSRDGKRLAMWSTDDNKVLYLMNTDGTGLVEKRSNVQILGAPQFWPDGSSVVFFGATPTSIGLFEWMLNDKEPLLIKSSVEGANSFAFSPDGSTLAYMEYNRDLGQAQLWTEHLTTYEAALLGSLPIPKGSGSAVPATSNMSWSADGTSIVFDVGRNADDRAIYLAHVGGTQLTKVVDSGYAPAISGDGKCLAYIRGQNVFLLELPQTTPATTLLLAALPPGRSTADYRLDKLQWQPGTTP